jgi:hypothetical protein
MRSPLREGQRRITVGPFDAGHDRCEPFTAMTRPGFVDQQDLARKAGFVVLGPDCGPTCPID